MHGVSLDFFYCRDDIGLMEYVRLVSAKKLYLPAHCGVVGRELRSVSCVTLVESRRFALAQYGMFSWC